MRGGRYPQDLLHSVGAGEIGTVHKGRLRSRWKGIYPGDLGQKTEKVHQSPRWPMTDTLILILMGCQGGMLCKAFSRVQIRRERI